MRSVAPLLVCVLLAACSRPENEQAATPPQPEPQPEQAAPEAPVQPAALVELSPADIVTPELSGTCNLEAIDGVVVPDAKPIEAKGREFQVAGWVIDDAGQRVPSEVQVRIASQSGNGRVWQQAFVPANERPDVQQSQGGSPDVLKSGFSGSIQASSLEPGLYGLRLAYVRDGKEVVCDNGRSVLLK